MRTKGAFPGLLLVLLIALLFFAVFLIFTGVLGKQTGGLVVMIQNILKG